jgi:hypothetical protein
MLSCTFAPNSSTMNMEAAGPSKLSEIYTRLHDITFKGLGVLDENMNVEVKTVCIVSVRLSDLACWLSR